MVAEVPVQPIVKNWDDGIALKMSTLRLSLTRIFKVFVMSLSLFRLP